MVPREEGVVVVVVVVVVVGMVVGVVVGGVMGQEVSVGEIFSLNFPAS